MQDKFGVELYHPWIGYFKPYGLQKRIPTSKNQKYGIFVKHPLYIKPLEWEKNALNKITKMSVHLSLYLGNYNY